jgi:hypothetical protein
MDIVRAVATNVQQLPFQQSLLLIDATLVSRAVVDFFCKELCVRRASAPSPLG